VSDLLLFTETFFFVNDAPQGKSVEVKVLSGAGNVLGKVVIPLLEVLQCERGFIERDYMLEVKTLSHYNTIPYSLYTNKYNTYTYTYIYLYIHILIHTCRGVCGSATWH
jgi:hypothetical protein